MTSAEQKHIEDLRKKEEELEKCIGALLEEKRVIKRVINASKLLFLMQ